MHPKAAYARLLAAFGPQGWWPLTPRGAKRPVYVSRRGFPSIERDRVEIAAGAILTQNAAWTNVEKALENLHREKAVSLERLAAVATPRLASWVRPSGYFRQKALKLRAFARAARAAGGVGALTRGPLNAAR